MWTRNFFYSLGAMSPSQQQIVNTWFQEMNEVSFWKFQFNKLNFFQNFRSNKFTSRKLNVLMISSSSLPVICLLKRDLGASRLISSWKRSILWRTESTFSIRERPWQKMVKKKLTRMRNFLNQKSLSNIQKQKDLKWIQEESCQVT